MTKMSIRRFLGRTRYTDATALEEQVPGASEPGRNSENGSNNEAPGGSGSAAVAVNKTTQGNHNNNNNEHGGNDDNDAATGERTGIFSIGENYNSTEFSHDVTDQSNADGDETTPEKAAAATLVESFEQEGPSMSIDEAIEKLGMGRFQVLILWSAGLCFAADSMEVLLLSFLAVVLQAQWGLTDDETASITSGVFIGASVGTLVLGYAGDRIGRKPVFMLTAMIICFFGFMTALTSSLRGLVFCRFMVGFGVGGLTVPFDTLAEFVPNSHRGRDLLMIEYFWTFGTLLVPVVAMLTLGRSDNEEDHKNEWRWFVFLLGLPCLVSSIFSIIFVPESPRWLLTQGKNEQALSILRDAARKNGKNETELFPPGTALVQDEEEEAQHVCDLFKPQWRWTTLLLWCVWGGFAITYYSTILEVTDIFAADEEDLDTHGTYSFDYSAILASASSELVGTTLAILAVDRAGRIPVQVVSYAGGGLSVFVLTQMAMKDNTPRGQLIAFGFLSRMFFMGGSCTTWVSTAEILTTEVRSTGHSWANAVARMFGALSPYLVTQDRPFNESGIVILVVSFLTAMFSSRLPETKGHSLGLHSQDLDKGLEVVQRRNYNIV